MSFLRHIFFILYILLKSFVTIIWKTIKILIPLKYQMKDIVGEIALVTGGGNGLGRFIALELSKRGAIVVIWDINENGIKETIELVQEAGGICYGYVCDLCNRGEIYEKAVLLRKEVGEVTILINNAGVVNIMTFQNIPDNLFLHTIKLNLISQVWTVKAFLPAMIKNNKGHIVSIVSMAAYVNMPFITDYITSKYALFGFYNALDKELRYLGHKVNITLLHPFFIHSTGFNIDKYLGSSLIPMLNPKEVAIKTVIAMQCNKKNVIIPRYCSILPILIKLFPETYMQIFRYLMKSVKIPTSIDDKMFDEAAGIN